MFLPLHVDVPEIRKPWANWIFCAAIVVIFFLTCKITYNFDFSFIFDQKRFGHLMLQEWNVKQIMASMWLHASPTHLIGNLLFLWLFGNAVCTKVGNIKYIVIYLGCGIISGMLCCTTYKSPCLGASAAINGIIGMYLVFYPVNEIEGYWLLGYWYHRNASTNTVPGYFIVPLWFAFDLFGAIFYRNAGIGYLAHIAGFLTGLSIALILLATRLVKMERDEISLPKFLRYGDSGSPQIEVNEDIEKLLLNRGRRLPGKYAVTSQNTQTVKSEQKSQKHVRKDRNPVSHNATKKNKKIVQDGLIHLKCICGKHVKISVENEGKKCRCPRCNITINVPRIYQ